jgi:hypothetical protein
MIGSRLVSLALVEEGTIHLLGCHHLRLAFLLLEDGVGEFIAFVEDGDLALNVLVGGYPEFCARHRRDDQSGSGKPRF